MLHVHQEVDKHKRHCEELNTFLDLSQKCKKEASIKIEINMIKQAAHNIIGNIKYILNEKNKRVEVYKRKLIESSTNMWKENYRDSIKYGCQNNLDESSHV